MAINYEQLMNRPFPDIEQSYTSRDTILYALGIGVGADPLDDDQVRFTFEEHEGFAPLPTMPVVMAGPGFWVREPDSGITWQQVLHGEQRLTLHNPMPPDSSASGALSIELCSGLVRLTLNSGPYIPPVSDQPPPITTSGQRSLLTVLSATRHQPVLKTFLS